MNNILSKNTRKNIAALTLIALLSGFPGLSFARSVTSETDTAGQSCSVVTLTSDSVTQTAGYTQTNPSATPISQSAYAHPFGAATPLGQRATSWVDPSVNTAFNTSSSTWISTDLASPGETGNTEGSSTMDQWRLFHDQFTIPAGATVTAADIWYTADNAAAIYQNGTFLDRTGGTTSDDVFGAIPTAQPQVFANVFHNTLTPTTGVNTIDVVTRNWAVGTTTSTTNPTGLLYKAVVRYCMPAILPTVKVTITKYIDGQQATASSTNSADFPMSATWDADNLGAGNGQFVLSAAGFNASGTPYHAITADMTSGASYSVSELTDGAVVSASCTTGKPFALVGYTSGNTLLLAQSATPTTAIPSFTGLTSDKYVIVWNKTCAPVVITPTTGNLMVMNTVSGGTATTADFQVHVMKGGLDITNSPQSGSNTGTSYNGIATGTYTVSRTAGLPINYTTTFSGDCDTSGNVTIVASTTKTCALTNTFTGTTTATSTGTGSLEIMTVVNGGPATTSAFQIHVKKSGVEISGSPYAAVSGGFTLSSLMPDAYTVSQTLTSGTSSDYSTVFSGDCATSGNVTVLASTTKTCTITNTFIGTAAGTTTPTFLKVHLLKYLDGNKANATSAGGYLFPMTATWQTANLNAGNAASGTFSLGNSFGQASDLYGADTALMQSPASYSAAEVTGTATGKVLPIGAACTTGMYRLKGYTTSALGFADAATRPISTSAPSFTNLTADRYVIVWDESCGSIVPPPPLPPPGGTPQAQKQTVLDGLLALQNSMTHDTSSWWTGDDKDRRGHRNRTEGKGLLADAIRNIRASLDPHLWKDSSHVSDTSGDTVFDREQDAVLDLMHIMENNEDGTMNASLQGFVDQLVEADHLLATTAIADAISANGNTQKITKAGNALTKGNTALQNGRILRAMWRYQNAWGFAVTSH